MSSRKRKQIVKSWASCPFICLFASKEKTCFCRWFGPNTDWGKKNHTNTCGFCWEFLAKFYLRICIRHYIFSCTRWVGSWSAPIQLLFRSHSASHLAPITFLSPPNPILTPSQSPTDPLPIFSWSPPDPLTISSRSPPDSLPIPSKSPPNPSIIHPGMSSDKMWKNIFLPGINSSSIWRYSIMGLCCCFCSSEIWF